MKKPPLAERAVAAIARYERAAGELGAIKKGIVAELEKCPITIEAYQGNSINGVHHQQSQADIDRLWDGSRVRHHLHQVLKMKTTDGGEWDRERSLHDYEVKDELRGLSFEDGDPYKCEHCLAAWLLIERRKLVRQELGHAKRLVRALGKLAIKAEPAEPERSCAAKDCHRPRVDGSMFCGEHQSVKDRWPQRHTTNEQLSHMTQQDGYQQ